MSRSIGQMRSGDNRTSSTHSCHQDNVTSQLSTSYTLELGTDGLVSTQSESLRTRKKLIIRATGTHVI